MRCGELSPFTGSEETSSDASVLLLSPGGSRFWGSGSTLADFRPPGPCRGEMTLRDCSTGVDIVPLISSAWARPEEVRVRVALGHACSPYRCCLCDRNGFGGTGPLVKSYRVLALHTSLSRSTG